MPYLIRLHIQPVPHFPDSQCLVFKPPRCCLLCTNKMPYLTYSILLFHPLHYNEINLVCKEGIEPHPVFNDRSELHGIEPLVNPTMWTVLPLH